MTDTLTDQEAELLRLFRQSDDDGKADILGIAAIEVERYGRRIVLLDGRP